MTTRRLVWKWVVAAGLAVAMEFALPSGLLAGAPPKAKKGLPPKVKPPLPKPGPKPLKPPRFLVKPRFWHPYARLKPPLGLWASLGYAYYAGGTDYVSDDTQETEASSRLEQLETLADMIHEWRTINESPDVHKRLTDDAAVQAIAEGIRKANQEFDKASRAAMAELAEGRDAAAQLETARAALDQAIAAVESLPEK